jgi:hypothetical protein
MCQKVPLVVSYKSAGASYVLLRILFGPHRPPQSALRFWKCVSQCGSNRGPTVQSVCSDKVAKLTTRHVAQDVLVVSPESSSRPCAYSLVWLCSRRPAQRPAAVICSSQRRSGQIRGNTTSHTSRPELCLLSVNKYGCLGYSLQGVNNSLVNLPLRRRLDLQRCFPSACVSTKWCYLVMRSGVPVP